MSAEISPGKSSYFICEAPANFEEFIDIKRDCLWFNFFLLLSFQVESVELALNVLDGTELRGKKVSIERAQFQQKGEYNPALKPRVKKHEKEKIKKIKEK